MQDSQAMKGGRNRLRRAVLLLVFLVALVVMWRIFEHRQVYFPSARFDATGAELARPFEDVVFSASDGVRLHGWFYPADTNSPRRDLVVVYCHGNAGNISHRLDTCQALLETGVGVLLFDYRGYGRSGGRPSEEGTYLDAQAACQWLKAKGIPGLRLIGYGESLGGGVASELALREPLAGLIIQSSFTSVPDLGSELFPWLPVRWLCSIKYDTRSKLPRVGAPVLIMHSRSDEMIRFHHAEENFAAAKDPKLLWEISGGHNDAVGNRERYVAGIRAFLELIERGNAKQP